MLSFRVEPQRSFSLLQIGYSRSLVCYEQEFLYSNHNFLFLSFDHNNHTLHEFLTFGSNLLCNGLHTPLHAYDKALLIFLNDILDKRVSI